MTSRLIALALLAASACGSADLSETYSAGPGGSWPAEITLDDTVWLPDGVTTAYDVRYEVFADSPSDGADPTYLGGAEYDGIVADDSLIGAYHIPPAQQLHLQHVFADGDYLLAHLLIRHTGTTDWTVSGQVNVPFTLAYFQGPGKYWDDRIPSARAQIDGQEARLQARLWPSCVRDSNGEFPSARVGMQFTLEHLNFKPASVFHPYDRPFLVKWGGWTNGGGNVTVGFETSLFKVDPPTAGVDIRVPPAHTTIERGRVWYGISLFAEECKAVVPAKNAWDDSLNCPDRTAFLSANDDKALASPGPNGWNVDEMAPADIDQEVVYQVDYGEDLPLVGHNTWFTAQIRRTPICKDYFDYSGI